MSSRRGHLVELVVPYDKVQLLCDIIFYVRDDFSWSKDSQPKFHRTYLPKVHINKNKYENKKEPAGTKDNKGNYKYIVGVRIEL